MSFGENESNTNNRKQKFIRFLTSLETKTESFDFDEQDRQTYKSFHDERTSVSPESGHNVKDYSTNKDFTSNSKGLSLNFADGEYIHFKSEKSNNLLLITIL